jgi:glycerate kinase
MAVESMPVLIAPGALSATLRAPVVAAAIGRGLERAGVAPPPDLCPVADGGRGTIEVLLPALGGETGDGFALVEDGGTALVEHGETGDDTGRRVVAAVAAGAEVVVLCGDDGTAAEVVEAIDDGGGLRGAALVVLCETGVASAGELAVELRSRYRATLVPGPAFVLGELGFDARMRAARAVVVGEAILDRGTLAGRVAGEIAIRARQAGVSCHAVVGRNAIDSFDVRILDLQAILEATTLAELEAAGERLRAAL